MEDKTMEEGGSVQNIVYEFQSSDEKTLFLNLFSEDFKDIMDAHKEKVSDDKNSIHKNFYDYFSDLMSKSNSKVSFENVDYEFEKNDRRLLNIIRNVDRVLLPDNFINEKRFKLLLHSVNISHMLSDYEKDTSSSKLESQKVIEIETNDNKIFILDADFVSLSPFFKEIADVEIVENGNNIVNVVFASWVMNKIIEYIFFRNDNPIIIDELDELDFDEDKEYRDPKRFNFTDEENAFLEGNRFVEGDYDFLNYHNSIIDAADFLQLTCCIKLFARFWASKLNGKSVEEMRFIMNIENDFTPEEEEAIRKEHAWIDE